MSTNQILHELRESEQLQFLMQYSEKPEKVVVCFVDLVNSTEMTSQIPAKKIVRFYEIFLNFVAKSVEGFNAKIIKNLGDSILFYFVSNETNDIKFFERCVECCNSLLNEQDKINSLLDAEGLPRINYRISADYGEVIFGKSSTSYVDDIIGECVDIIGDINHFGLPHEVIIGKDLYNQLQFSKIYKLSKDREIRICDEAYSTYLVKKDGD
ncbi:MAG: hypothetical protein OER82_01385 [Nitrosopumilus sp.]|nr:hypothetical protein [Nitrosopumilus sp.]